MPSQHAWHNREHWGDNRSVDIARCVNFVHNQLIWFFKHFEMAAEQICACSRAASLQKREIVVSGKERRRLVVRVAGKARIAQGLRARTKGLNSSPKHKEFLNYFARLILTFLMRHVGDVLPCRDGGLESWARTSEMETVAPHRCPQHRLHCRRHHRCVLSFFQN